MENVKIKTSGMHCASCEMIVSEALTDLEGVNNAKANHKTGIIEVDFDDEKVDMKEIKEIIKKEGYDIENG